MNNLNNIPGEILKTSQLPDDMPTHLVGVIIGTSPKTVKYSTTLFASQIASQMTDVVRTSFVYTDPTWLGSLNWNKITSTPSTILGYGITDAVSSSRTLSINGTTYDLSANRSWTVGDVMSSGSYVNPSWINSLAWTKITGVPAFLTNAITSLNGLTGSTQTFGNDTNVTMVSTGTTHTLTWLGTLADSRIASSTNWNTAYSNRITSLTTTGSSGSATLVSNTLNIPTYTLAGLGGISYTSLSASTPLSYNNLTGAFSIQQATTSQSGYLSSTDWNTFNGKQDALGFSLIAASGTQVVLTSTSVQSYVVTGSGGQVFKLPDATTLPNGKLYYFNNNQSTGAITVNNNSGTLIATVPSGGYTEITLLSNSIAAGSWERHEQAPSNVSWSTNTFDYPGSITSATWNGVAIADGKIASAANWNTAYSNRITSLTTTGSSGAATLVSNVLNIPNYTLSGLGYTTPTLDQVTTAGNTTTNGVTVGSLVVNGTIRNTIGSANLYTSNVIGSTTITLHSDTPISSNYFIRADTQSVILNAPQSNGFLLFRQGNGSVGQFFGTTGNFTLQNGGTFTDAGFRLDVNGTARIQNQLTTTGSITAASAIARGVYMNQTLVAAANNDVLVGLQIAPTFTNGAFTGVNNNWLELVGNGRINGTNQLNLLVNNVITLNVTTAALNISSYTGATPLSLQQGSSTKFQIMGTTGNVVIQNGGTFTDAGYRFDVNGTTRLNGLQTFQGTTASDTAPLGSELLTTGTGTNWTGTSFATGYTHTVGSTATLTSTLAAVVGNSYQITYTITGRTAGSIQLDFGGSSFYNITATGATGPKATTTGTVVITPTTDFDGVLVLSIKVISGASATTTWTTSAGTASVEMRVSNIVSNIFIGGSSGRYNTTGFNNVFLGTNAGAVNTTGAQNIAIGSSALVSNTTGTSNFALGTAALSTNITGNQNVAIGASTLQNIAAGSNNLAFGYTALFPLTSGNDNIAIGATAGRYISGGSTNATTVNQSIFIGSGTKPLADSQTNQIVIGYNTVGLGSNTTIIGNSSTVTTALYGNLLLGTTTATGAGLTVSNAITASSAIARGVYFNQTLTAAANGDVLIGLDINPTFTNGAFTGVTQIGVRIAGTILPSVHTGFNIGTNNAAYGRIFSVRFSGTSVADLVLSSTGTTTNINFQLNDASGNIVGRFFNTTGNLVLQNGGTFTDAGYRLDVVGADSRFNGIRAGLGAGQVATNTVFGNGAASATTSASNSVFIGYNAGNLATTSANNTFLGYGVAPNITNGGNNTFVGFASGSGGNVGSSTAIGYACNTGGFSGVLLLGSGATATANNQFVVGSSTVNAGAVTTAIAPMITEYWTVKINGVDKKIAIIA